MTQTANYLFLFSILFVICSCGTDSGSEISRQAIDKNVEPAKQDVKHSKAEVFQESREHQKSQQVYETFDRSKILENLKAKIAKQEPLLIHVFVPLCDNENQGIVPVSKSLGDGLDLKSNLYWGAKYGLKNYFIKYTDWTLIKAQTFDSGNVLERLFFEKTHSNSAKVKLVIDAYRGDKMKACLSDYLQAVCGDKKGFVSVEGENTGLFGNADLIVFNGHNGLMDYEMDYVYNTSEVHRDAAVIACASHRYFTEHFKRAKAFPYLMTTNFMAPEAYVLEGLIDAWVLNKNARKEAGRAYNEFQKCGINGATRLFKSGW